jgi:hypothetical protein
MTDELSRLERTDYRLVQQEVKRIWNTGTIEFSLHAVAEMEAEQIDEADVQHVIRFGKIVGHEEVDCIWTYRFHGKTVDGSRAAVVVSNRGNLIIVTVFLR